MRRSGYFVAVWVRRISLGIMIAVAICTAKKLPAEQPDWTGALSPRGWSAIVQFQSWFTDRPWITPVLLAVWGFSTKVRDHLGAPRLWKLVKAMLTRFRDDVFEGRGGTPVHRHRVTLFVEKSGRLVPMARSGDGAKCSTCFDVRDGMDANSLAAAAYLHRKVIPVSDLPTPDSPEETINHYAESSFAKPAWIKERLRAGKQCSRALLGIPVEISYKVCGVLLIDSLHVALPNPLVTQHRFQSLAISLGLLLESEGIA